MATTKVNPYMPAPNRNNRNSSTSFYYSTWYPDVGSVGSRNGPVIVTNTESYVDLYQVSSIRTAGFRTKKHSLLPVNPYSKQTILYRDPLSTYVQKARVSGGYYLEEYTITGQALGCDVRPTAHTDANSDDPTQKVISKVIEQLKLGQAQTGVALAEAGKTASHVAHTAERIAKAIMALRKGRLGDFTSALGVTASRRQTNRFYTGLRKHFGRSGEGFRFDKRFKSSREYQESRYRDFMAQTWLEYTYGWKPLLQDTYDHAKAFAKIFIDHSGAWRVAKARGQTFKHTFKAPAPGQYQVRYEIVSQVWREIGVTYRIPTGVVDPVNVFGLNNPLTVAWEVVPFSFVVDWFIPIGNALEALTAYSGLQFLTGWKSSRGYFQNQGSVTNSGKTASSGAVTYTCLTATQRPYYAEFAQKRELLGTFPEFGMPRFKDPRSFSHAASAIALLQSLFLSGGSRQVKLR